MLYAEKSKVRLYDVIELNDSGEMSIFSLNLYFYLYTLYIKLEPPFLPAHPVY